MQRIIIVHWNKSSGPEPIIQYPPERSFPPKELFLKIWTKHELGKEKPFVELFIEETKEQYISIIQELEGEIYFLIMVYIYTKKNVDHIIRDYPDTLASIGKELIVSINTNKLPRAISEAFNTIKNYSKFDIEVNLLNFFHDKLRYTILKILRKGAISKNELANVLRQDYGFSGVNTDLILISFLREKLIEKRNIPGIKECYFLVNDLSCSRMPPLELPVKSDEVEYYVIEDYKKKLFSLFANYDSNTEIENKILIRFLMDKDVYSLLKTLREKTLSVSDCINILNNKEELFSELLERNLIYEAKGVVYILSDFRFIKFTPYYLMEKLSNQYKNQKISYDEYITHLKLLTEKYKIRPIYVDYEII